MVSWVVKDGGKLPLLQGAMSITGKGRQLIGEVTKYIEEKYHGKAVYGDSVAGHTPILVKHGNGMIEYVEIKDLLILDDSGIDKEHYNMNSTDIEIWTKAGWTRLISFMRHKTASIGLSPIQEWSMLLKLILYLHTKVKRLVQKMCILVCLFCIVICPMLNISTQQFRYLCSDIHTCDLSENITEYYQMGTTDVKEKFL